MRREDGALGAGLAKLRQVGVRPVPRAEKGVVLAQGVRDVGLGPQRARQSQVRLVALHASRLLSDAANLDPGAADTTSDVYV